jgi:hypothetical protein
MSGDTLPDFGSLDVEPRLVSTARSRGPRSVKSEKKARQRAAKRVRAGGTWTGHPRKCQCYDCLYGTPPEPGSTP